VKVPPAPCGPTRAASARASSCAVMTCPSARSTQGCGLRGATSRPHSPVGPEHLLSDRPEGGRPPIAGNEKQRDLSEAVDAQGVGAGIDVEHVPSSTRRRRSCVTPPQKREARRIAAQRRLDWGAGTRRLHRPRAGRGDVCTARVLGGETSMEPRGQYTPEGPARPGAAWSSTKSGWRGDEQGGRRGPERGLDPSTRRGRSRPAMPVTPADAL
jgi:hypothetical protein